MVTLAVLVVGLVLALLLETPWRPLPGVGDGSPVDPAIDFTAAQMAREDAYHSAVRPPAYASLVLSIAVAMLLGLTAEW